MPNIDLIFSTSTVAILLLAVLAAAVAILFYRYTLPPVPPARRLILVILRTTSLMLILSLFFEPLLQLLTSSSQPPTLAVLVDNSLSMQITDRTGSRSAQIRRLLETPALRRAPGSGEVRHYVFGHRLQSSPDQNLDSLAFTDDATDLSAALSGLASERERRNIPAAVLLTDGSYNIGQNPVYEAERLGIPLYTVGIGDSSQQRDVMVTRVVTNELVYNESTVPVDVTIKSSGYDGERVEIVLTEGRKELDRKSLVLRPGTSESGARLSYVPEGEGMKRYAVSVSRLEGELTHQNNQRIFFARVLRSRLQVLILAGAPGPDASILRHTLGEDKNITVRTFIQRQPSGFYEGPLTKAALDSADCIVLVGFPTTSTAAPSLELLRSSLTDDGKPLLFVAGSQLDDARLGVLRPVLPFTTGPVSTVEQYVFFQPSEAQRAHPILNTGSTADVWSRMPPVFRTQTQYRAKAEATVLGHSRIQTVVLGDPLILTRNVSRQKCVAFLGYGIWRWRLMAQGNPETAPVYAAIMVNSIRWLTTREDSRPVKIVPAKEMFTQGESVEFIGQVYDASAQPVANAGLRVTVQHGEREFETILRSMGNGRYEGSLEGLPPADYTFRAVATANGQQMGEDRGRFSVGELNLEYQDTRMNAQLLRQIAFRSGGEFFSPEEIDRLTQALQQHGGFEPREITSAHTLELWNWQYTLALIILLFSLEWFIRKRSGML